MTALTGPLGTSGSPSRPAVVAGLRLLRLVGSGGEGEVWEARDPAGRRRALKLVRPEALADDVPQRIAALLRIEHPALVRVSRGGRVLDGRLAGWGFVEMDFVEGPSLQEAPSDPAVLERLAPLAAALDLLHAGAWSDGVPQVHRDVKPANLVDGPDGLVLVDPSTLRGVDTGSLTRVGTPVYSAPEVMTGRFGPPADVYSFGVTVVALITGEREGRLAALVDDPATLDALPDGVARALSPRPEDRPASCAAVLRAGAELADDPDWLPPVSSWAPAPAGRSGRSGSPGRPEPRTPTALLPHPDDATGSSHGETSAEQAGDAGASRRRVWPWTWLLVALVGVPVAGAAGGVLGGPQIAAGAALAAAVHLLAHLAARRPLLLAVGAPPVAWALLLAVRVPGGRLRQGWAGAVLTAATCVLAAGLASLLPFVAPGLGRAESLAWVAAGLVLVLAGVASATARGAGGALLRVLMLPLWLAGAVVVTAGAALLAPFVPTGRALRTTLASIVEVARSPRLP